VIELSRTGDIGLITIDRPERRNALDAEHCGALTSAVGEAVAAGCRVLVLTGSGSSFCAGADLDQVYDDTFRAALYEVLHAVADAAVPVIAAVNGPAIGAGTQLAIASDLRVADPSAVFAIPTARNGLAVDPWTIQRLVHIAGGGTARAVLLGCERVPADRALARGLADRIGGPDDALAWAEELAGLAPLSLAYSKRALATAQASEPDDAELLAAFEACWVSEDGVEARRARAERREPLFTGR
jgi:enoyl-CoA hydratase